MISAELCCRGEWAIVILAEWLHQGMEPFSEGRTISPAPETESPLMAKTAPVWATDDNLIVEKGALGKGHWDKVLLFQEMQGDLSSPC